MAGQHAMNSAKFEFSEGLSGESRWNRKLCIVSSYLYYIRTQLVSEYLQLKEKLDANWQKSLLLYSVLVSWLFAKALRVPPCPLHQPHHGSPAFKHVGLRRLLGIHMTLTTNKCVVPIFD